MQDKIDKEYAAAGLAQYDTSTAAPPEILFNVPANLLMHERIHHVIKKHLSVARKSKPPLSLSGKPGELPERVWPIDDGEGWVDYIRSTGLSILEEVMTANYVIAETMVTTFHYEDCASQLTSTYTAKASRWFYETGNDPETALRHGSLEAQQYFHILCHEKAGKKVYEVSPGLAAQLADTELHGLVAEDVRLPYEAMCLAIPSEAGLRIWNEHTGWHPIEAIYIVEDVSHHIIPDAATRCWRFLVSGRSKNQNPFDDALLYFAFPFPEGVRVDDIIKSTHERIRTIDVAKGEEVGPMIDEWVKVFRWVMNAIIYATWPDAEREHVLANKEARHLWERIHKLPKGNKTRTKLLKTYNELDPRRRVLLGKTITYISRDQAAKEDHERHTGTGRPLFLRVRVQGHWKKQFHGPKRSLRKLIWIQPYWKGPEEGAMRQAVHRLAGSAERSAPPIEKKEE